ncbi:MAG TPA: dTDP-4-dehydrorhamnose 3,5-epimerase family protein [Polyangia bacterium]|nr:dTDP-4-dehydrorhamnose 3,5-epimerase family protein [Polyangia bacterium]
MIFTPTPLEGVVLIVPQRMEDDRGFFARLTCQREMAEHGLDPTVVQRSVSYNRLRGTLRGMHYQLAPHQENKLVSCLSGAIYDVVVDLRPGSPTHRRWYGATLTPEGMEALFVPRGCAHGFITLADETRVHYEISDFHHAESARGVRYDDPAFGIAWPLAPVVIADRDRSYPAYTG